MHEVSACGMALHAPSVEDLHLEQEGQSRVSMLIQQAWDSALDGCDITSLPYMHMPKPNSWARQPSDFTFLVA